MSDRPTQETDAFAIKLKTLCGEKYWVPVDIARKLERERDEALELLASEKITRNHIIKRSVEVERERDEANEELHKQLVRYDQLFDEAEKIRIERDEAREKIEQQRKEIVRFNGATSHAGGTPLKISLRERDEARAALMKIEDLFIDGTDIYADRENMGLIARNALEKIK